MKLLALSLIAMFMVTANALIIPMDSMGDASGLVKRQDSDPKPNPNPAASSSSPTPTEALNPCLHRYLCGLLLLHHLHLVPVFSLKSDSKSIEEKEWVSKQEPLKVIKIHN
ncbi:hypothetical protein BASA50_002035 [Batrachochytrium salamandrivorans]|uniref:Uncharacterized protein n=1 Tax=Batrachochytrium salamandrivorans TaxID=1357716 RepID=A0ABQ8FMF0_9FUNG|nr:hypothetical protein BASA50_002035 [Batrachochytrium salamandrivorans]